MLDAGVGQVQGSLRVRSGWVVLVIGLALALGTACRRPPAAPSLSAGAVTTTGAASAGARLPDLSGADSVGSAACSACHAAQSAEWTASAHATTVRAAAVEDEDKLASMIPCSEMEVTHVLGKRHHLRYLQERPTVAWGQGRFLALPCGWDVGGKQVEMHHADDWRQLPWETSCAACHVTGYRKDHSFLEPGVGCERCHGPGSLHVKAPSRTTIVSYAGTSAAQEVTTCASCHLQGGTSMRTRQKYPDGFLPGGNLFDDYVFDWKGLDAHDTSQALDVHQKLIVRRVTVDHDDSLRCTSCHALHSLSHEKHEALPRQDFCGTCHESDMKLKEYRQSCPVCEF